LFHVLQVNFFSLLFSSKDEVSEKLHCHFEKEKNGLKLEYDMDLDEYKSFNLQGEFFFWKPN